MTILWSDLKQEIMDEADLNEETFIIPAELDAYGNSAIDDIEAEIHCIDAKYFETEEYLPFVAGQEAYDLPESIFANKITGIYYSNGSDKYEIKPLKNKLLINDIEPDEDYRYRVVKSPTGEAKLKIYPAPREDSESNVTIHYIRNALRLSADNDIIDIPEARGFIKQFVMDKANNKETMTPGAPESPALARQRKLLVDVLSDMTPDDNKNIEPDHSWLCEQV